MGVGGMRGRDTEKTQTFIDFFLRTADEAKSRNVFILSIIVMMFITLEILLLFSDVVVVADFVTMKVN